jgi:hypothetical protein
MDVRPGQIAGTHLSGWHKFLRLLLKGNKIPGMASLLIASDLRIGNCLKFTGSDWPDEVRGKINLITASDIVDIEFTSGENYEAVSLNPEILLNAGFQKTTDTELELKIDDDNKLVANPYIEGGYAVQLCCQTNWSGQKPRYLHQVQNLYYALTGKELAIKI